MDEMNVQNMDVFTSEEARPSDTNEVSYGVESEEDSSKSSAGLIFGTILGVAGAIGVAATIVTNRLLKKEEEEIRTSLNYNEELEVEQRGLLFWKKNVYKIHVYDKTIDDSEE